MEFNVGEFLVINITDISLLVPVIASQSPEPDRILAEEHFEIFPVPCTGPEFLLAEQPRDCPGQGLVDRPGEIVVYPDYGLDPFPLSFQCAGIGPIQDPGFSCQFIFQFLEKRSIFRKSPVRTPEEGIHFYKRKIQGFGKFPPEGCLAAAASTDDINSHILILAH